MAFRAVVHLPQLLLSHSAILFVTYGSGQPHTLIRIIALLMGTSLQVVGGAILVIKSTTLSGWVLSLGGKHEREPERPPK
jgi:hypothetical protein